MNGHLRAGGTGATISITGKDDGGRSCGRECERASAADGRTIGGPLIIGKGVTVTGVMEVALPQALVAEAVMLKLPWAE